jgi:hypothetical protein
MENDRCLCYSPVVHQQVLVEFLLIFSKKVPNDENDGLYRRRS